MKDCGQQWRFAFYETILVTVLATASESSRSQVHALQNSPVTTSGNLDGRHDAGTPTANAAMPPVELDAFSSLSSNSLLTSSAPSDDLSYCPCESCKSSFKGKSQKTNLTRHLKTVLHHKQNVPLKCQFCQKNISSRTDNFQQHMRNIHNVDSPLKKQRTHDRGESRDSGD